jgi:hypothetical protein
MATRLDELTKLMRAIPPRSSQALSVRLIEGRTREAAAQWFGITADAFDVKLYRAAVDLGAAARGLEAGPPLPFADEQAKAAALAAALDAAPSSKAVTPEASLLRELGSLAGPLREALLAAERAYLASPHGKRADRLRDLLVVIVILVTAYFFLFAKPPS